ncbi:MAG TPA: TIGR04086 family membrane protein [Clostridia bacterium]|nr:TIGR04086 family membrane protein [Clostridia bacterium]
MKANLAAGIENKHLRNAMYILRGSLIALAFSTIAILIFALIVKSASPSDSVISIFNQLFKIISIFIAAWASVRAIGEKGWLFGGISGVVFILLGFIVFSIIDGSLSPAGALWGDLLTGLVAGSLSGMITMYIKK